MVPELTVAPFWTVLDGWIPWMDHG